MQDLFKIIIEILALIGVTAFIGSLIFMITKSIILIKNMIQEIKKERSK